MPSKFDTAKYTANFSPLNGNPFVSVQDVMQEFGDVAAEIIDLLPDLLKVFTSAQLEQLLASGLDALLNLLFPTDGSQSPLISALDSALGGLDLGGFASALTTAGMTGVQLVTTVVTLSNSLIGIPGSVLSFVESEVGGVTAIAQSIGDSLVTVATGLAVVDTAVTDIASVWRSPLSLLFSLPESIEEIYQELLGKNDSLQAQITVLQNTTTPATPTSGVPTGGTDDCSSASTFTNVLGTLVSNGTSIRSSSTAVGYHTQGPQTDSHGTRVHLTQKLPGTVRQIICSDTAMDNYAALEIRCDGHGNDYARVVVGFGPNTVIAQNQPDGTPAQWNGNIGNDFVFGYEYDGPTNTFIGYINGTQQDEITWVDSGNQVSHGSTKREVGWCSNATGAASPSNGFALSTFIYYDKVPA